MASKPHLLMRVLQAIIYRLWTVLFFLTAISLLGLVQYFWPSLFRAGLAVQGWVMTGLQFLQN